jgi:hypothetical protein
MPVLLCHVVWMPRYAGEDKVHAGGFDYVQREGFGHELFNFMPIRGVCYGYVQTRTGVVNIDRLGAERHETFIDDVTVIWTAPHPNGERVVVGWYRDARIYRACQLGRLQGRHVAGQRVGYISQAPAERCVLVPEKLRVFKVPHSGRGLPGQSSVFYPESSTNRRVAEWLDEVRKYISGWRGSTVGHADDKSPSDDDQRTSSNRRRGWSTLPDAAHNAAVEDAAIACVRQYFGRPSNDRQKDNCGWDLEFGVNGRTLCVEVKGLSGTEIGIELTPNEFEAMKRAMNGTFEEGDYRLAVVCEALTHTPQLFLFVHDKGMDWRCEYTQRRITAIPRTAARLE